MIPAGDTRLRRMAGSAAAKSRPATETWLIAWRATRPSGNATVVIGAHRPPCHLLSAEVRIVNRISSGQEQAPVANEHRNSARAAGVLFLVSYLGFGLGGWLLGPVRDPKHDLAAIQGEHVRVLLGVVLEFVNVAAIIGFAVLLLPYLRRAGESLAHGYVAMRILEGVTLLVPIVGTASLVQLSKDAAKAPAADAGTYRALQQAVLGQGLWASTINALPFLVGASLLYVLLFRTRLVPRFIPIWGLIAVALLAASNVLAPDKSVLNAAALLAVPIVLNEFFLAVWLIVKGFNTPPATQTDSAPPTPALPALARPVG